MHFKSGYLSNCCTSV